MVKLKGKKGKQRVVTDAIKALDSKGKEIELKITGPDEALKVTLETRDIMVDIKHLLELLVAQNNEIFELEYKLDDSRDANE